MRKTHRFAQYELKGASPTSGFLGVPMSHANWVIIGIAAVAVAAFLTYVVTGSGITFPFG